MGGGVVTGVVIVPGVATARVRLRSGQVVTAINGLHVRVPPHATVLLMWVDAAWHIVSRERG